MIKSLFEPDAPQSENEAVEKHDVLNNSAPKNTAEPQYIEVNEAENPLEFSASPASTEPRPSVDDEMLELFAGIEDAPVETPEARLNPSESNHFKVEENPPALTETNFDLDETSAVEPKTETVIKESPAAETVAEKKVETIDVQFSDAGKIGGESSSGNENLLFQTPSEPQSFAETARQSGLAYAAAITLFASVIFMLIIGWFADLLFGSSPWGKVGGIVLGSLIGFIQLFRISSQIFKKED